MTLTKITCAGVASLIALLCSLPAMAQNMWADETFLTDYSKLAPVATTEGKAKGKDYLYFLPDVEDRVKGVTSVMVDQPEVFIAADSPYKGLKPEDLAAIAGALRSTATAALQQRGYKIVDKPAPDALYVRMAVTGLKINKKKRKLLAYTPVGFVVNAGVKALQDLMDKYDILDMALQVEVQDSVTQEVLGAAVIQRGEGAESKQISFDLLMAALNEYSDRFACRLDNGHVEAPKRINCFDPAARKTRPMVVGQ